MVITKEEQIQWLLTKIKENKLIESIDDFGHIDLTKISNWENIEKNIIEFFEMYDVAVEKIDNNHYPAYKLSRDGNIIYINYSADMLNLKDTPLINKYLIMLKEQGIDESKQFAILTEIIDNIDSELNKADSSLAEDSILDIVLTTM